MTTTSRFTVRITPGRVPETLRLTFFWSSTWIVSFSACGTTLGSAVTRRGHAESEKILRPRAVDILRAHVAAQALCNAIANGDRPRTSKRSVTRPTSRYRLLLAASRALVAAYAKGEQTEHVEWEDLDDAHRLALEALRVLD